MKYFILSVIVATGTFYGSVGAESAQAPDACYTCQKLVGVCNYECKKSKDSCEQAVGEHCGDGSNSCNAGIAKATKRIKDCVDERIKKVVAP